MSRPDLVSGVGSGAIPSIPVEKVGLYGWSKPVSQRVVATPAGYMRNPMRPYTSRVEHKVSGDTGTPTRQSKHRSKAEEDAIFGALQGVGVFFVRSQDSRPGLQIESPRWTRSPRAKGRLVTGYVVRAGGFATPWVIVEGRANIYDPHVTPEAPQFSGRAIRLVYRPVVLTRGDVGGAREQGNILFR